MDCGAPGGEQLPGSAGITFVFHHCPSSRKYSHSGLPVHSSFTSDLFFFFWFASRGFEVKLGSGVGGGLCKRLLNIDKHTNTSSISDASRRDIRGVICARAATLTVLVREHLAQKRQG